jgi:hypothetical protein
MRIDVDDGDHVQRSRMGRVLTSVVGKPAKNRS